MVWGSGHFVGAGFIGKRLCPCPTFVGPEVPLVNGIADAFRMRGWPIVAPSQQAAQLEGSKIFAKEFLHRHGIPTAQMYGVYDTAQAAVSALSGLNPPVVITADGLCAGKGAFVAQDASSAEDFIRRAMDQNELGTDGKRLLLEETLEGEELSSIVLTDAK